MRSSWTSVEKAFIAISGKKESYEIERASLVEVQNVYELGKIVALSFLEWIHENPAGVIALPTGKTPEYFIKTLERYKKLWDTEEIQKEVKSYGFSHTAFPKTSELKFIMLDEFFPMLPTHRNSFCNYVRNFYTGPLGISSDNVYDFDLVKNNVLSIGEMKEFADCDVDLSLLSREPTNDIERTRKSILLKVQKFCDEFEQRVRNLGGIGFFLGGIGPDGHIAFNQEGADHASTTRLVNFNYPTAAAAAGDLGGIEIARGKAAMTIGLGTISYNKNAKVIIMAAGEGKATVIRAGVEEPADKQRPSSILHSLPNSRFYVTHGAASKLSARKEETISRIPNLTIDWALNHLSGNTITEKQCLIQPPSEYLLIESCIYNTSLKLKIAVHNLTVDDMLTLQEFKCIPEWLRNNPLAFKTLCACASRRLKEKIEGGLQESQVIGRRILHTAPHHDDIMLSYHGAMHDMLGRQPSGTVAPPIPWTNPPSMSVNAIHDDHDSNVSHSTNTHTTTATTKVRTDSESSVGGVAFRIPPTLSSTNLANATSSTNTSNYVAKSLSSTNLTNLMAVQQQHSRLRSGSFTAYQGNTLGEKYNGNVNHFAYLTSGFHSVNDDFLLKKCIATLAYCNTSQSQEHMKTITITSNLTADNQFTHVSANSNSNTGSVGIADSGSNNNNNTKQVSFIDQAVLSGQMTREYDDLMTEFRDSFFHFDEINKDRIENIIFLRKVAEVWNISLTQSYAKIMSSLKEKDRKSVV